MDEDEGATERLAGWCCIGCGKVEIPRPCIGVCQDRPCELVRAGAYDEALGATAAAREDISALSMLVRRLAWTTPRAGEWERSYRALQTQARRVLSSGADGADDPDGADRQATG